MAFDLLKDLTTQLHEMSEAANNDIIREKERSRAWCEDRWANMHDETAGLRHQRDQLLKLLSDTEFHQPVFVRKD